MKDIKISMRNINKVFSTDEVDTHALIDVNLDIHSGEFVSISGPSGCGKSTLLSILGLLDNPTDGQYMIDGEQVSGQSASTAATLRNEKIGFIFQSFNLIDELSVAQNVAMPLRFNAKALKPDQIQERVARALETVDVAHRAGHRPNQLSGGQQQRVAIARAIVGEPALLLVDEPTGNLDSKNGDLVMKMLADLNAAGTTICMVTHDPRYAEMAGTQYALLDGKITKISAEQGEQTQ